MKSKQAKKYRNFMAVIFSNIMGNQLYPLTKNFPVSTLPIGNKKLIVYQLEQLESITDISTIIVLYSQQSIRVKQYLEVDFLPNHPQYPHSIQLFPVEDNQPEYQCLQKLFMDPKFEGFEQVKGVFIIPPDVISSIKFNTLLNQHVQKQADITMFLKDKKEYGKDQKKPDYQYEPQVDIALVNSKGEILGLKSIQEYQFAGFNLNPSTYQRISRACFKKVVDTRIYLLGPKIIKIVKNLVNQQLNRIKSDFIDTVIKNQINLNLLDFTGEKSTKPLRIHSRIAQQNEYIRRVCNVKTYQNINLDSLIRGQKQKEVLIPNAYTQQLDQKAMSDYKGSLIGKQCQIEAGTKMTRSVIQSKCKVGKNVQIVNSIVMSGSCIQQGCKISNSVVGPNCHIKMQSVISNCQMAMNCVVEKGSNNEKQIIIPLL